MLNNDAVNNILLRVILFYVIYWFLCVRVVFCEKKNGQHSIYLKGHL